MKQIHSFLLLPLFIFCTFFSSVSNAQQWKWARQSKCTGHDTSAYMESVAIAVDKNGSVYTAGEFQRGNDTFEMGTIKTPLNYIDSTIILVKLDSSGNVKWLKKAYHSFACNLVPPIRIISDNQGYVWICGLYVGIDGSTLSFDNHICTFKDGVIPTGSYNFFIAKYDSNGNALLVLNGAGFDNNGRNNFLASDHLGNIYFAGTFDMDTVIIGNDTLYNSSSGSRSWDTYLAKFNNSGTVQWVRKSSGSLDEFPTALTVDGSGNAYISGKFTSATATFGTHPLNGPNNYFIVKYDASGNVSWANGYNITTTSGYGISYLTTDDSNRLYVSGHYKNNTIIQPDTLIYNSPNGSLSNCYLARINAANGNAVWAKNFGTTWKIGMSGLFLDAFGFPWVCGGYVYDTTIIGNDTLHYYPATSKGDFPLYMAQFDTLGNVGCVTSLPFGAKSQGYDQTNAQYKGYIYINADPRMVVGSKSTIGSDTIVQTTYGDLVIAKFQPCNMPVDTNHSSYSSVINSTADKITIYPNPAYDEFTVSSTYSQGTIELYNISGQLLKTYATTGEKTIISTSELAPGIYFCKFSSDGNVPIVKKVMLVK